MSPFSLSQLKKQIMEQGKKRREPDWLITQRLTALHVYEKQLSSLSPSYLGKIAIDQFSDSKSYAMNEASESNEQQLILQSLGGGKIKIMRLEKAVESMPDMVQKHLGTIVSPSDNPLAALNSAIWWSGTFIYVPPHTKVPCPLTALFNERTHHRSPFERHLIILDEGAELEYIEGCSASLSHLGPFRAPVTEVAIAAGATLQYMTIQNWGGKNVIDFSSKKVNIMEHGSMTWLDSHFEPQIHPHKPHITLMEKGAQVAIKSLVLTAKKQLSNLGHLIEHAYSDTHSSIAIKVIQKDQSNLTYKPYLEVSPQSLNSTTQIHSEGLQLSDDCQIELAPTFGGEGNFLEKKFMEELSLFSATDCKLISYLNQRGFHNQQIKSMIVHSFIREMTALFPMEYAVELEQLIDEKPLTSSI